MTQINSGPSKVRAIPLTGKHGEGKFAIVDLEDFAEVSRYSWHVNKGYPERSFHKDGKVLHEKLHKFIYKEVSPGNVIDHINNDKLDNRKANLRECTPTENKQNQSRSILNTSGFKGVSYSDYHGAYAAYITQNKRRTHLGYFKEAEEAARLYDSAAVFYHGEFANLNFPGEIPKEYKLPPTNTFRGVHYSKKDDSFVGRFMFKGKTYSAGQSRCVRKAVENYNSKVLEILGDRAHEKLISPSEEDYLDKEREVYIIREKQKRLR